MVIEPLSSIHVSNLQPKNPPRRSFSEYFYTKEIIAGRIRGELLLHQTEIKTDECIVNALGIFFKPSHSQIEISLGLVAAPVRVSLNLAELNSLQKMKAFVKTLYRVQVLRNMDKRLHANSANALNIPEISSSFPHLKAVVHEKDGLVHYQTGYSADTFADFIEILSEISEEAISLLKKKTLVLAALKNIIAVLDNLPRKSHGDFHPKNILVSIQHEEPEADADQPVYTPSHIKTYAIDIGSLQNIIAPSLKEGKLFYTKQDDLQNLFTHLEKWWSPHLDKLLGITQLTRVRVVRMLEQQDKATQRLLLSDALQEYQLQRLSYLLDKNLGTHIDYKKEELQRFAEKIRKVYEVDEEGDGAPTVIMPWVEPCACSS